MRLAFIVSALLAIALGSCSSRPRPVAKFADDIRKAIPDGWNVTVSNATVSIRSQGDIILITRSSRPVLPGGMEQLAREVGHTTKYLVTLAFIPLMSRTEVEQLRAARSPFEQILEHGTHTKSEYTDAKIGYEQHRVPVFYTEDYSVFVEHPNDRFVEVYPPDAAAQVAGLLTSLKGVFREY